MLKSCRGGVARIRGVRDIATLLGPTWFGVGELGIGLSSIAWSATERGANGGSYSLELEKMVDQSTEPKGLDGFGVIQHRSLSGRHHPAQPRECKPQSRNARLLESII